MEKDILMRLALYLGRLINAYTILIWVRIALSWFVRGNNEKSFTYYIGKMVDPYLKIFKGKGVGIGMLDFSPILAIGLLYLVEGILNTFGTYGKLTFGSILALFLQTFYSYGVSIFTMILMVSTICKVISTFVRNPMLLGILSSIGSACNPLVAFIKSFSKKKEMSERTSSIIALVIAVLLYFLIKQLFVLFVNLSSSIPF